LDNHSLRQYARRIEGFEALLVDTKEVTALFTGWINDNEYAKMYPEINNLNTFSISTLSQSVWKQVYWKRHPEKREIPKSYNEPMFEGKSAHEYFQRRLVREGWQIEYPFRVEVSYNWTSQPFKTVVLLGHADAYHPGNHILVEIKRSRKNPFIYGNHILQAGVYSYLLAPSVGLQFPETFVVKVNTTVRARRLNIYEIHASWGVIRDRALEAARLLDVAV
jgi:hypothetical protein